MKPEYLPKAIEETDIRMWDSLSPQDLIHDPARVYSLDSGGQASRAIKYSRSGANDAYDEIGFRMFAANQTRGEVALQTIPRMRLERHREARTQVSDPIEVIVAEQHKLRHRLIDLLFESGRFSYRIEGNLLQLVHKPEDADAGDEGNAWTFPLSAPLKLLQDNASPNDAPLLITQRYRVDLPGLLWLPLTKLIQQGRLNRMQDVRHLLVNETQSANFYCFVSHRWLSAAEPDPDGLQAAFIAWQLFSYLCEAVRIARYRGLNQPRLQSPLLGIAVGISGSELADALIVNVLRPMLDEASLERLWGEAKSIESLVEDYGVEAAASDIGLGQLRKVLDERPLLSSILARIHIWYDYACMPQPPRVPEEETVFRHALENLVPIQIVGHTVVLLDDAEDYLMRGWCTLEALVADTAAVSMQLLVGSPRRSARDGTAEHYFYNLLQDRPHIVWRGILDTDLFGIQTAEECLRRLNLAVTDPGDLPFIYKSLRRLPAPAKIHTDNSELVTGLYPLPETGKGRVLAPQEMAQRSPSTGATDGVASVDWTEALRVASGWITDRRSLHTDPFIAFQTDADRQRTGCHVAIVAACEGEAVLFLNWIIEHRSQLESALGSTVESMSWLATDIAPVGSFVCGTLQALPVSARECVVVATAVRHSYCLITGVLEATMVEAGVRTWQFVIDRADHNLSQVEKGMESGEVVVPVDGFPIHNGGLFRGSLRKHLLARAPQRKES
jgi:hypothetical protein